MHRSSTPNYANGDSQASEAAGATTLKKTFDHDSNQKEPFNKDVLMPETQFKHSSMVGSTAPEKRDKEPVMDYLDRDSEG